MFINCLVFLIFSLLIIVNYFFNNSIEKLSFSTKYLLNKYKKLNIEINQNEKTLKRGNLIVSYKNHSNNSNSINICNNKNKTLEVLKRNNIPVTNFVLWDKNKTNEENKKNINNLKYPLVVKPSNGMGGDGVKANIKTQDELFKHINTLLKEYDVLIEEYVEGSDYRVFVLNNEIVAILERSRPFVIGDGKNTLKKIIEKEPHSDYKLNSIDNFLLKEQRLNLNSIIPKNKQIIISNVCNQHVGSIIKEIPINSVHKDYIEYFKKINKSIGVNLSGIDFRVNNIKEPYKKGSFYIIEVNARPEFTNHYKISKNKEQLLDRFINSFFKYN